MVHLYKMTSPGFFSFLKKYDSLGCYAGRSQKMLQMRKILLHSVSLKSYIKWFSVMILMCKMISPWTFSIFSKFWFGGLLGCVKGQKIAQNDKTFCLLCSISQEPYIMWLSFVVQKCKMISPGIFLNYFFKILIWVVMRVKGWKMAQNVKKKTCLRNHTSYILIYGTHV